MPRTGMGRGILVLYVLALANLCVWLAVGIKVLVGAA